MTEIYTEQFLLIQIKTYMKKHKRRTWVRRITLDAGHRKTQGLNTKNQTRELTKSTRNQ